jgi:2-oxoglutarate dehydrogenase complex dehydrogenase (E1) component-like enzyme
MSESNVSFPAVSADFIIDLYHRYIRDPQSVDRGWKPYFDDLYGRPADEVPAVEPGLEAAVTRLVEDLSAARPFHRQARSPRIMGAAGAGRSCSGGARYRDGFARRCPRSGRCPQPRSLHRSRGRRAPVRDLLRHHRLRLRAGGGSGRTPLALFGCWAGGLAPHFIPVDQETGVAAEPFNLLEPDQAACAIIGSPLSEYAVLGFEYGLSLDSPKNLVVWEAQFGDFANVAQVIIDQFVAGGQDKWLDRSGLVLVLPHGLEGQGPDHSSGRIERFLQLCANDNLTVANCTTPANFFHLLRRQARASERRPLVVFTPKSLLRHKHAVSDLKDFALGTMFVPVIGAACGRTRRAPRRVVQRQDLL